MTDFERKQRKIAEICLGCCAKQCPGSCMEYSALARAIRSGMDVDLTQDRKKLFLALLHGSLTVHPGADMSPIAGPCDSGKVHIGRPPHEYPFYGCMITIKQMAELCACSIETVKRRVRDGWSMEDIYRVYGHRRRQNGGN